MRLKIAVSVVRFRPWAPFPFCDADLARLFPLICPTSRNGLRWWDSWHEQVHGVEGETTAVDLARVERGLLGAFPSVDGHQLVLCGAVLGGYRGACLPETVRGAMA